MDLLKMLQKKYSKIREQQLYGRYVTMSSVTESLFCKDRKCAKTVIGSSVEKRPIELYTTGTGKTKILMWSQMHGNEATTTKAMADVFNFLNTGDAVASTITDHCTLYWIPILNPDGAVAYTRENANGKDLNRDAQQLSEPESKALRTVFDMVQPHFCFNLHDQRSIYGVGDTPKSAIISFLSPLQDKEATLSPARKKSMQLIVAMHDLLQQLIPGHVGRYDDTFNINCVGDTFQAAGVPTLLFEAGHFKDDYQREKTRELVFYALLQCLYTIAGNTYAKYPYTLYFDLPENKKTFFDILITDVPYTSGAGKREIADIGIKYNEILHNNSIKFLPILERSGKLSACYGHKMLNYKEEKRLKKLLKDENIRKIVDDFVNFHG